MLRGSRFICEGNVIDGETNLSSLQKKGLNRALQTEVKINGTSDLYREAALLWVRSHGYRKWRGRCHQNRTHISAAEAFQVWDTGSTMFTKISQASC